MERSLSRRELEIYHLVGEGLTQKEIAGRLELSAKTVNCYVATVARKLGLPDNAAAIRHAVIARSGAEWARLADEEGAHQLADRIRASYSFEDARFAEVLRGLAVNADLAA